MHICLLGVTKTFTNHWFDTQHHGKAFYLGKKLVKINRLLARCTVPSTTNRILTTVEERSFWKANQWRTWNLLCPVILDEFMPSDISKHFKKYLRGLFILNTTGSTLDEVAAAEKLLYQFVRDIPKYYDVSFCTFNTHLLLHAAECVRNWGPLYCYSLFQFENYNGILLGLFHGTQHAALQMATAAMEIGQVTHQEYHLCNPAAREMYDKLFSRPLGSENVAVHAEINGSVDDHLQSQIRTLLGVTYTKSSCKVFRKVIFRGILLSSKLFNRKGRSNSIFRTKENDFFSIRIHNSMQPRFCDQLQKSFSYT